MARAIVNRLRSAVAERGVLAHWVWAVAWTGVLGLVAFVVGGQRPQADWVLYMLGLVGVWHLLFQFGRWAERREAPNVWTRRSTRFAWILPVLLPILVVWDAMAA